MTDNKTINPCACGNVPKIVQKDVPMFDRFDEPTQPMLRCECGIEYGPRPSEEWLIGNWNEIHEGT